MPFKCPECGIQYDRRMRVWLKPVTRFSRTLWIWPGLMGLISSIATFGVLLPALRQPQILGETGLELALCFPVCSIVGFAYMVRRLRIGQPYVAATLNGLVTSKTGRPHVFEITPWERLRELVSDGHSIRGEDLRRILFDLEMGFMGQDFKNRRELATVTLVYLRLFEVGDHESLGVHQEKVSG